MTLSRQNLEKCFWGLGRYISESGRLWLVVFFLAKRIQNRVNSTFPKIQEFPIEKTCSTPWNEFRIHGEAKQIKSRRFVNSRKIERDIAAGLAVDLAEEGEADSPLAGIGPPLKFEFASQRENVQLECRA